MQDIKKREEKMQKVAQNMSWEDFVKNMCSRVPLVFHRYGSKISRYPETNRIGKPVVHDIFMKNIDNNLIGNNYS
ncbi:MAG: hypothetical protein GXP45_07220 [bacterium]|nr:hypothetical protein [bacterium]